MIDQSASLFLVLLVAAEVVGLALAAYAVARLASDRRRSPQPVALPTTTRSVVTDVRRAA